MELTTRDDARLEALERTIAENADSFWLTCEALAEIREKRFYKKTHRRFELYCLEVLGFSASRARHVGALTGVKVAKPGAPPEPDELVVPSGVKLRNVHRAELLRLPAPKRQAVLDRAVESADKAMPVSASVPKLTANLIKEAAAAEPDVSVAELDIPEQAFVDRELFVAIQAQLSAIKRELIKMSERTSARFMPLDPLVAGLRQVHAAIRHGIPYCWCVECGGDIVEREDCGTCKGLGFMSLTMLKQTDEVAQKGARLWNSATTK